MLPILIFTVALLLPYPTKSYQPETQSKWKFGLVDNWWLPVSEARAYLYNSTDSQDYSTWKLVGWGDADNSGNVTISGLPLSWESSGVPGKLLEYRLVVKLKVGGTASPITLGNWTILTKSFDPNAKLVPLGSMLNTSASYTFGPYGKPPNQWGRFRIRIFYIAFKVVDERGYPLPEVEVSASYCSEYLLGSSKGTLITNKVEPSLRGSVLPTTSSKWPTQITNGSCGQEFRSLQPYSPNKAPIEFGGVGWILLRVPSISSATGEESSLVKNITFLFKFRRTIVGNFTATRLLEPTGEAWTFGSTIDGRLDSDAHALTLDAELQGNMTQVVICSVRWVYINLYDQNHNAWPTRAAKVMLYDLGAGGDYAWPGEIVPTKPYVPPNFVPSLALIRYPSLNTSIKLVVTWFGVTVNETNFLSQKGKPGGLLIPGRPGSEDLSNPSNSEPDGVGNFDLYSDMVRVRVKLFGSDQLPSPLEPNQVDAIILQLEYGAAPSRTDYAKLSYWNGYVALPDSPLSWFLSSSDLSQWGLEEEKAATGWLPSGTRSKIDLIVKYMGIEVLDTRRSYPYNSTISLKCPPFVNDLPVIDPALTDYDKTLLLYIGIYDVGFRVFVGDSRNNASISNVPLFIVLPNGRRTMIWTDGDGVATLHDVPDGVYKNFTILYKMSLLKSSNIGTEGIKIQGSTKPLIELLFPAFNINVTVWNFHKTFKLVNVNVSFYARTNFSELELTDNFLDSILSSPRSKENILPEGWTILSTTHSDTSNYPSILYRTNYWSTTSSWPLRIELMPQANYSVRISVPAGERSRKAGFREADSNVTLYWSWDPWGEEVCLRDSTSIDIRTYVYDARVTTLDESGFPLYLFENSAIILAEPYPSADGGGIHLRNLQQFDPERDDYNAYLVRFNNSAVNIFHSLNASRNINDSDIRAVERAEKYPQQSRYLIGAGNLSQPEYRFIVYYRGVLVFNGSITLSNPYVSEENSIKTSVYEYVFRVLNSPLDGASFGIQNLHAYISWAGLNTSFWPTANLTGREAEEEFILLNSSKLQDGFDIEVVTRMWGPPADERQISLLPKERIAPYFSSYLVSEGGVTDSNGEIRVLIPVWNGSSNIFGSPLYFETSTIPGVTAGVPGGSSSAVVGRIGPPRVDLGDPPWSGQYPIWPDIHSSNITGLIDNSSARTMGFSRSNATGVLSNGLRQSPIIVRAVANDLSIIVKDVSGNILPNQRVEAISASLSLYKVIFTGCDVKKLRSSSSFIFWGAYDYIIRTTNLTDPSLAKSLELYGIQWLTSYLNSPWDSQVLVFQWPAQLQIQVLTHDGTPLERAWVFLSYGTNTAIDENSGEAMNVIPGTNVTASLTDSQGFAAGLSSSPCFVKIGMNVFRGTYLIRIFYSIRGSTDIYGPVKGLLVYDSFTDEPQYKYVYLGIEPPPSDTGEDWSSAQFRIVQTRVWSLKLRLVDDLETPLFGVRVKILQHGQEYDFDPLCNGVSSTTEDGSAWLNFVPGGMYEIEAEWVSPFCTKPVKILRTSIIVKGNVAETLHTSVHEPILRLVDASGNPIVGAKVQIEAIENGRVQDVGTTDILGKVQAQQVHSGAYVIKAYWHGEDISPDPLFVTDSREYVMMAKNVGMLVIQVSGAMGQGLQGASIEVWRGGERIFSGVTNSQGVASSILPYGEYVVRAIHNGLEATHLFYLESPTAIAKLSLEEFVNLFGIGLTPITTIIFALLSITSILLLMVLVHEYIIWRRRRLPKLFR
ncbi:MAG: carboxypeptidase-like regulatory domain-containing protein [Thermoproteota archaeon]